MVGNVLCAPYPAVELAGDRGSRAVRGDILGFRGKLAAAAAAQRCEIKDATEREEMSLTQYQAMIDRQLSEMTIHPALAATEISIQISDSAFARMKNDPVYETKVMGLISRDLNEGWQIGMAPAYSIICVGEQESEYRATSMGAAYKDTYEHKTKDRFWERRRKRRREMKEYEAQRAEKLATLKIRAIKAANQAQRRKGIQDAPIIASVSAAELFAGLV